MKKNIFFVLIICFAVIFFSCNLNKSSQVIAKVAGKEITMQDLQDEIDGLPAQYRIYAQNPDMKRKILDNLIMVEILMKEAEKQGVLSNSETQAKIKEEELNMRKDMEAQIINLKKRLEKVSENAKRDVVITSLLNNKDFKDINVNEEEISKFYKQYSANVKMQNPDAKVESLVNIKEDIRKSIARDKWLNDLKAKADITINENAFIGLPAPSSQIKILPEEKKVK